MNFDLTFYETSSNLKNIPAYDELETFGSIRPFLLLDISAYTCDRDLKFGKHFKGVN